jgi:hypothetical protein
VRPVPFAAVPKEETKAMSEKASGRLEGLRYALLLVNGRRVLARHAAYLAACDEMEIFLAAAIERVENGGEMHSEAIVS